jgi:quercetin dioxygenase-like cupin family protein
MIGAALALAAASAPAPLIDERLPPGVDRVRMQVVTIPPAPSSRPSTNGIPGHSHPGATYVYVLSGRVLSRLGQGPELPFAQGQAWSEVPGEAHYIVNASTSEPARLLVIFVVPAGTQRFTQPIDGDSKR